nr:NAD(+) diphosphatase [uncultured Methanoregula sp.]
MDHTAKFAADSLHKQYPLPDLMPEETLLVLVRNSGICYTGGKDPTIFVKISHEIQGISGENAQYLGHRNSHPSYALEIPGDNPCPEGLAWSGVRELAGTLPEEELAIAGLAIQVTDYNRTTRFCGRCGTRTRSSLTERAKVCPACHYVTYARLSPAVIVLVRNNNTILLAHNKQAPPGRNSLVAGFVEPGETIEHAVHREVQEETGISIKNVKYIASEPWPFPNSLMIGFIADYKGGTIIPDGIEIDTAGWFDRDHLPDLPPKLSISRALIDIWLDGKTGTIPPLRTG